MTKQQNDVKTFMQTFGQATPEKPTVPDGPTRILRVKLLLEEVLELAEASGVTITPNIQKLRNITDTSDLEFTADKSANLVSVADALADIDYVNQGAAVAYGLDLEPFQDEVHSSNMSKLWNHYEVINNLGDNKAYGTDTGNYIVKNSDGKVVKSPSYRPADLQRVMVEQFPLESNA